MQESGRSVKENYREHGISDVVRLNHLQEENDQLKRIVANLTLEIDALNELVQKHPYISFWKCYYWLRLKRLACNHKRHAGCIRC